MQLGSGDTQILSYGKLSKSENGIAPQIHEKCILVISFDSSANL